MSKYAPAAAFFIAMLAIWIGPQLFPNNSEEFERMGTAVVERTNTDRKLSPTAKLCLSEPVEAPPNLLSPTMVDPIVPLPLARLGHIGTILQTNLCLRAFDSQVGEQCPDALCRLIGAAVPSELRLAILREELRIIHYANRAAEHLRKDVNSQPVSLLDEDSQSVAESLTLPTPVANDSDTAIGIDGPSEISENVSIHTDNITRQEGTVIQVALTFYTCEPFCLGDLMANGQPLEAGDVACGYALDTGQRFVFNGAEYTCEDRGGGPYQWVDFWMPDHATGQAWQASVGQVGEIVLMQ